MRTTYHLANRDVDNIMYSTTSRTDLINAMATKSNWNSLLKGTLNGTAIDYSETTDTNIYAMGSPTLELWANSWNTTYPSDILYTRYIDTEDVNNSNFYSIGYAIGKLPNPSENSVSFSTNDNTLYFSPSTRYCGSYWLIAPAAVNTSNIFIVDFYGGIHVTNYDFGRDNGSNGASFSPIICLPSSVVNQ